MPVRLPLALLLAVSTAAMLTGPPRTARAAGVRSKLTVGILESPGDEAVTLGRGG